LSVEEHRAGSALAYLATVFGARKTQVLAQDFKERPAGVCSNFSQFPVNAQSKEFFGSHRLRSNFDRPFKFTIKTFNSVLLNPAEKSERIQSR